MTGRVGTLQRALLTLLASGPVSTRELAARVAEPTPVVRRALRRLQGRGALAADRPIHHGRGGALDVRWQIVAPPQIDERDADVLDSLVTLGPSTIRELAEDTGRTKGIVRLALLSLASSGRVRRRDGHPARWEAA